MAINLGDIQATLTTTGFNEFSTQMTNADKQMDNFSTKLTKTGKKFKDVGKTLSTHLTLPIVAAGAAAIKFASDAEEAQAKFDTAFGGVEEKAEEVAKNLSESFGLARQTSKKLLGDTGDLLKGFGATAEGALDFSKDIQELSVDLSSYNNVVGGASRVSKILTKAVLGNKDGLIELGVSLLDTDIKQELVRRGQENLTGQAGKLAKAQATFALILEQTGDAQGDYARTSESTANQLKLVKERTKDLSVEFGTILLPVVNEVITEVLKIVKSFSDLDSETKELILKTAGFAAAIGPLTGTIGNVTIAVGKLGNAFKLLAANPYVLAISAAVATIGIGLAIVNKELKESKEHSDIAKRLADGTATYADKLKVLNNELEVENKKRLKLRKTYETNVGKAAKNAKAEFLQQENITNGIKNKIKAVEDARDAELTAINDELQAVTDAALKKIKLEQEEADATAKKKAAQDAVIQKYVEQNNAVQAILDGTKSEIELIDEQIESISELSLAEGQFKEDQLEAIEILEEKKREIIESDNEERERLKEIDEEEKQKKKEADAKQIEDDKVKKQTFESQNKLHLNTLNGDIFAALDAEYQEKIATAEKLGADTSAIEEAYRIKRKDLEDQVVKEDAERRAKDLEDQKAVNKSRVDLLLNIASIYSDIQQAEVDQATEKLNTFTDLNGTEIDLLESKAETEEGLTEAEEKRLDDLNNKRNKLLKEQWEQQKEAFYTNQKLQMANAAISGAQAAVEAFKSLAGIPLVGPVLGAAAAASAAVFTFQQIDAIGSQKPPAAPTYFAEGGIVNNPGAGINSIVGEAGPEAILPLTDETFRALGNSIVASQQAEIETEESSGGLGNLVVVIEGLGEMTIPITQDALDNGQLTVNAASIIGE